MRDNQKYLRQKRIEMICTFYYKKKDEYEDMTITQVYRNFIYDKFYISIKTLRKYLKEYEQFEK